VSEKGPSSVGDLTRDDLGKLVEVEGWTPGYLYVLLDEFHDGYPSRTLTLVLPGDYGDTAERSFTDSDPAGCPKTMGTPVSIERGSSS
jgi:hypothetical protein